MSSSLFEKYFPGSGGRRGPGRRVEEKGQVVQPYMPTSEGVIPHPPGFDKYAELCMDPEVSTAITVLTGMVVGAGVYTEMPEDKSTAAEPVNGETPAAKKPVHPNKKNVDDWAESINLDETLAEITRTRFSFGFCPVLKRSREELFLPEPKNFYKHRDQYGRITGYSLRTGPEQAPIEKYKTSEIIFFSRFESLSYPYGVSIVEPIRRQLGVRNDMNEDIPEVYRRIGYPFRMYVSETKAVGDVVYNNVTGRDTYEAVFLDGIGKDQLTVLDQAVDPRFNPTKLLEHIDFEISEGLHAPLLMYLRNATEASATKMLETINRENEAEQRYLKRRVEKHLFKPLVGEPTPRLMFGSPDPDMKAVSLADLADLIFKLQDKTFSTEEARKLLRNYIPLSEGPMPVKPRPILPQVPFANPGQGQQPGQPALPGQDGDLETSLGVLEEAYRAKQITVEHALREGGAVIEAHLGRAKHNACRALGVKALSAESEKEYHVLRNELFDKYRERLMPMLSRVKVPSAKTFRIRIE